MCLGNEKEAKRAKKPPSFKKPLFSLTALILGTMVCIGFLLLSMERPASSDPVPPNRAKPHSAWSLAHLYSIVSSEPPLNQNDLDHYIKELPLILKLSGDLSLVPEILAATGWTENRLVYVATKVGMGLKESLEPEPAKIPRRPAFAMPSPMEARLIAEREGEIEAAFNKIIQSEKPQAPAKKAAPKKQGS
jgi:hypothetical protein